MATKDITPSTLEQITSLSQLHYVRQIIFMVILAGAIALGTAVVMWSRDSNYTPLYMSLSPGDSSEIITVLEQMGTEYRINAASGVISVPGNQLEQVRLQLASQGLPRSTSLGYEILGDDQPLSTSNFMEQARFNHALEQELVRTIKYIRSVQDARVHLSIPKQTSFIRNNSQPSASVMLNLMEGQKPGASQLAGIIHLVASSVAGLSPDNVSIVDQYGNLLSQKNSTEFERSAEHLRIIREIEDDYTRKVVDILSPIVGESNVRAQVSADIDFTIVETTSENYDPETITIRSEQVNEERTGTETPVQQPVESGTLSSLPPATTDVEARTQQPQATRINSVRNYEVDHSVSYSRNIPGALRRLSVAVLVDLDGPGETAIASEESPDRNPDLELQRLERLTQLVRDSIGYNPARGDSVNVISEQFAIVEPVGFDESFSLMEQGWIIPFAKQALAGLVVILILFGVLKPALRSTVSPGSRLPHRALLPTQQASGADITADTMQISSEALAKEAPRSSPYDRNLMLAQQVVQAEPVRAARMIKEWVASD